MRSLPESQQWAIQIQQIKEAHARAHGNYFNMPMYVMDADGSVHMEEQHTDCCPETQACIRYLEGKMAAAIKKEFEQKIIWR